MVQGVDLMLNSCQPNIAMSYGGLCFVVDGPIALSMLGCPAVAVVCLLIAISYSECVLP